MNPCHEIGAKLEHDILLEFAHLVVVFHLISCFPCLLVGELLSFAYVS